MNSAYKKIQIEDLDALKHSFIGYYWYSDQQKPESIKEQRIDSSWFTQLPFVVEAHFYAPAEKVSVQVRYLDGTYHAALIDLNIADGTQRKESPYIAHDLPGHESYYMIEAWESIPDPLLDGMSVLQPAWAAFTGFRSTLNSQ